MKQTEDFKRMVREHLMVRLINGEKFSGWWQRVNLKAVDSSNHYACFSIRNGELNLKMAEQK